MKTRFALLITAALLAVGLPIPAHAATPFTYTVSGGNAMITGYNGTPPTNLVIPDEISDGSGTYPVTAIGSFAFSNSALTELTLPGTITSIVSNAFSNNYLRELTLPDGLTGIDDWAFFNNRLTELALPDTLTTIGNFAFTNNQLTELALPDALTTIGNFAFTNNQLAGVRFTGSAPLFVGTSAFGASNPTVRFPWQFGEPRTTGGYTTPTWNGHTTIPVADVTFTGGGNVQAQQIDVDGTSTATKPTDPVNAGNRFTGWFTDGATTTFDFATPITGDTALTAGFEPVVAPILTGPRTISAKLGAEVTWEPTALTGDPAATVTATGLPAGLTIDDTTGVISGKVTDPSLARNHTVTITASNGVNPAATHTLTISIEYFTYSIAAGNATITGYHGTTPTDLVIPDEITDGNGTYPVTAIGNYAFSTKGLTSLALPDSVTIIGDQAFRNNQLTELTLPESLTTIRDQAFQENLLTTVALPTALKTIGNFTFAENRLTDITVPPAVTAIGYAAFLSNPLTAAHLTGETPSLGAGAFGEGTPTLRFPWKQGEPRATGGFTTPTWKGYPTIAVAEISFVGGGTIDRQLIDVDGTAQAVKPADPVKAGHDFTGWFTGGAATPFDFATPIAGDTILTAGFAVSATPDRPADRAITGLAPAIVGDPREGKTLQAKTGTLSPSDATATYQWRADGSVIKGATKATLKLAKDQAGRRITVTITASAVGAPSVARTSSKTKIVASSKPRLVLSSTKVAKNKPVTVTVTGFKARQKITIWLGGKKRYAGRADSRGVLTKTVTVAKATKPGRLRVRVIGEQTGRDRMIQTTIRYR